MWQNINPMRNPSRMLNKNSNKMIKVTKTMPLQASILKMNRLTYLHKKVNTFVQTYNRGMCILTQMRSSKSTSR